MPDKVRMIVTHVNDDGTSGWEEQFVDEAKQDDDNGNPIFRGHLLYGTPDGTPQVGSAAPATNSFDPFYGGVNGHRFTVFAFLPDSWSKTEDTAPAADAQPAEGGDGGGMSTLLDHFDKDRPGMHITDTIDYVYVISGEVGLELDDGEVQLKPGDTVVQRGTWHAWRNHTEEPCWVAAVLIGAERTDKAKS